MLSQAEPVEARNEKIGAETALFYLKQNLS